MGCQVKSKNNSNEVHISTNKGIYKAKLVFYSLNKQITNLENSEYLELEINKKELVNLIEIRNTIGLLIQGNRSNKNG